MTKAKSKKITPLEPQGIYEIKGRVKVAKPVMPPGLEPSTGSADKPCGLQAEQRLKRGGKIIKGRNIGKKGSKKLVPTCWVQLVWKKGDPSLRFCTEMGKPATLVPVSDASQARRIANAYCKCVEGGKSKSVCAVSASGEEGAKPVPGLGRGRFQRKPVKIRR